MMQDDSWLTRTVSLRDRFGDNGLISVVLAKLEGDALVIDTWLMSCRVLKRGVEQYVLNHLGEFARRQGLGGAPGRVHPDGQERLGSRSLCQARIYPAWR